MNVLVTGGAGYIGSHTVVELMNAGHRAIIVDDLSNARWDVHNRIGEITGRIPAFYQIDCADKMELRKVFSDYKIDAVIHFAGFKAVGESVREPLKYYRNNLDSTLTLLEVMEEAGLRVKNLRYFGSQPWGYGSNLLLGFFCELDGSDEIHFDHEELSSAVWIRREDLEPVTENRLSLTGTMIETFRLGREQCAL